MDCALHTWAPLFVSSAFFGFGIVQLAHSALAHSWSQRSGVASPVFLPSGVACDYEKGPQTILSRVPGVNYVACSILEVWPVSVQERLDNGFEGFDKLATYIAAMLPLLRIEVESCLDQSSPFAFVPWSLTAAGPPCVDVDSMRTFMQVQGNIEAAMMSWCVWIQNYELLLWSYATTCGVSFESVCLL